VSETLTLLDNPYWDVVKDHVNPKGSLWGTPEVGGLRIGDDPARWVREAPSRRENVCRYSWSITDPETVAFVAEHSRGRLVDPMAGTGYWAWMLAQSGVDVVAYDLNPPAPGSEDNHWHRDAATHVTVHKADATDVTALHADRTLMLSWPPYGFEALRILHAYDGDRLIYVGCCGDDAFFEELADERLWVEVAERVPVQWFGMHDVVTVYDRKATL
jgi:hypothetical protein